MVIQKRKKKKPGSTFKFVLFNLYFFTRINPHNSKPELENQWKKYLDIFTLKPELLIMHN